MIIILLNSKALIKWNPKNKKRLCDLGYMFTKMGDAVWVEIQDLSPYSNALVSVKCDYCGAEFTKEWCHYRLNRLSAVDLDACKNCRERKAAEAIALKYGSYKNLHEATNEKRRMTNTLKYGTDNPFGAESIKRKIVGTNMKKYGVAYNQQNKAVRDKTIKTCMRKYGVQHYVELLKGKYRKENSPVWKGGIEYSRAERATLEYNDWRRAVFMRDMYTCQKCGARTESGRSVELNAHHIYNWKDHPDKRYNPENGITLCSVCHTQFHSIFGKSFNTPEQLLEFLNYSDEKIC